MTVTVNPLSNSRLECNDISITNIYQDVKWFFPKLKNGHMLVVPLSDKPNPPCALFVKELNKIPNTLDIANLMD